MTSSARPRSRWPLHPLTAAAVLALAAVLAGSVAATTERDLASAGAMLALVAVAGASAGFANSGST